MAPRMIMSAEKDSEGRSLRARAEEKVVGGRGRGGCCIATPGGGRLPGRGWAWLAWLGVRAVEARAVEAREERA